MDILEKCMYCIFCNERGDEQGHFCSNMKFCTGYNKFVKRESKDKKEMVNHPKHYNTGKFEVIEVIEDWNLNFNLGNAVKYISRCEHKGNKKQDLEKAVWYLQRELDKLK